MALSFPIGTHIVSSNISAEFSYHYNHKKPNIKLKLRNQMNDPEKPDIFKANDIFDGISFLVMAAPRPL